jgi:riboflavin kinase/FMN adenylyltransferase
MIPQDGIYFAQVDLKGTAAFAMVSIGVRPTFFTQGQRIVEANILDFDGDLYGRALTLQFLHRLRDERKFENAEELVKQMHADEQQSRKLESEYRAKVRKENDTH